MAHKIVLTLTLTVVSLGVKAATDRTWDGGGADANWNNATNWNGDLTVPASGDALFFGGTSKLANTNDLDGASFSGITFLSGAGLFTLRGKAITLDGNVTNLDNDNQTINLPMTLSATRDFTASNGELTVSGTLSGAGGLNKYGAKTLTLSASNAYEGVTSVANGTLAVTHANALGSTNGNTVVTCSSGGYLQFSGGIAVAEPITLSGERPTVGGSIGNSGGSNTLYGAITTIGQIRTKIDSGTLVVRGGVRKGDGGSYNLVLNASGTLIFLDTPLNIGANTFFSNSSGVILLGVTGNVWGKTQIFSGVLRMGIANALPSTVSLEIGTTAQADGVLDLNGFDQAVGTFGGPVKANATGYLTSTNPATLTVNQGADKVYERPIHGAVSFVKTGASTLTMSNSLSTTTGNITVSNGTLVVAMASSLGNSANVTVAGAASVLELRTSSGIADAARLSIADGGTVKIGAGLVETVDRLFLDGTQQARGSWGATGSGATYIDDGHFTGTGQLLVMSNPPVTPADATWDAEGADTLLSTTNNWAGDLLPAFNGATYARFGTGGSTATVDRAVSLYGMEFTRDGDFTVAAGDGVVTNGAGGITAAVPNATSRAYAVSEDLILSDNQVWNVTNNGAGVATLTVSGSVGSDPFYPFSLTKAGNGTLVLSGGNTYEGVTTVANGTLAITHGGALGGTNGNTVVNCASGGFLQFSGNITVDEPITFNGELAGSNGSFLNNSGSNTLRGAITTFGQVRTKVNGGSVLVVRGGIRRGDSGTGNYWLVLNTVGTLAFYDTPLTLGYNVFFSNAGDLIVLGVAGNTWSETQIVSGTLRLDIANALPAAAPLKIGISAHASGILDLNGFDQTVGSLGGPVKTNATSYLTSAKPATLTVNQSADAIYERPLNGAVSLVKAGTATLTMSNSLSTTTGDVTVNNGTLVVAPASNLGNSTNIAVAAGTLTIQTSSGISDSASLFIADGGAAKVNLAAGVNETVSWLYLGGKMQRAGTYSAASGSGVMVTDTEHFAGTGILTVLHDKSGTLIKLQ